MARNITVTFEDGSTHVYQNAPDNITPEQVTARAQEQFKKRVSGLDGGKEPQMTGGEVVEEVGRVADKGVRGGLTALPGMLGDVFLAGIRKLDEVQGKADSEKNKRLGRPDLPMARIISDAVQGTKFGDVTNTIQTAAGLAPELSKPKTELGKAAGNILESTVSTVATGGAGTVGQKAVVGAASGAGGEGAARLFGDNPLVRFIGSLLGGGTAGVIQARTSNANKLVKQATEHMTDADWQKAQQLEEVLNAQGIQHAKSQLLGPRSTLDDVVATASANPTVRPKLTTATEGAPRQAEHALNVWTNQNLPPPGPASRAEVLSDVQEAASNTLRTIKDKSNQAFTKVMPPKHIEYDEGRVRTLYNGLKQLADDPRFGATTDAGKAINKLAEDLVEGRSWDLSRVHPVVLQRAEAAAKAAGQTLNPADIPGARQVTEFVTNAHKINNLNKELKLLVTKEDYRGLPIGDVRRILNEATPEFNRARDAKAAIMESQYNPTSKGLVGQIAQMGGGVKVDKQTAKDTALSLVFNPTQPQGQAIKEMAQKMGGDQVGELLREHISRTMQTVLKGEDKSPRNFVQALYESPAQRENIEAALDVVARQNNQNPEAIKVGFRRLMESLDSFKDLKTAGGVSPGTTAAAAGQNIVSQVATPLTGTRRFFEQRVTASTYNKIADLVTQPDGLKRLQAIAKAKDPDTLRQIVVGTLTSANQTPKSGD